MSRPLPAGARATPARFLQHRQRIAGRAGDLVDDVGRQHDVRDVLLRARDGHRHVERAPLAALDVVGHHGLFAGADLFAGAEREVGGRFDLDVPGAWREIEERKAAVAVGGRLVRLGQRLTILTDGDDGADERAAGASLAELPTQGLAWGSLRGGQRRQWRGG